MVFVAAFNMNCRPHCATFQPNALSWSRLSRRTRRLDDFAIVWAHHVLSKEGWDWRQIPFFQAEEDWSPTAAGIRILLCGNHEQRLSARGLTISQAAVIAVECDVRESGKHDGVGRPLTW